MAAARGGRAGRERVRPAIAEPRHPRPDPRRVRSHREALARPAPELGRTSAVARVMSPAGPDCRHAGGGPPRRAARRHVRALHGGVRAVPWLRGGVPVIGAVRPLDGRRAGRARRAPPPDTTVAPAGRRVARLPRGPPAPLAPRRPDVAARTRAARAPGSGTSAGAEGLASLPRPAIASTRARRARR